jgi:3-dehydroquinate dehydratase II
LGDIEIMCAERCKALGHAMTFRQTNHEGELVTFVQEAADAKCPLILNPAAYGHTSVALHDALKLINAPLIEVHLSNPAAREPFRHHSYSAPLARAVIAGCGGYGYVLAIEAAHHFLQG